MSDAVGRVLELFRQTPKRGVTGVRYVTGRRATPKSSLVTPVTWVTPSDRSFPHERQSRDVTVRETNPHEAAVRVWAEGFARLDLAARHPDFSESWWRAIVKDGGRFLEVWAPEAARLGWRATDLFGVHPIAPSTRFDTMGLVPIISGGEVISMNERGATIRSPGGQLLFYMRRPLSGAVCLWDRSVHDPDDGAIGHGPPSTGDAECLDDNSSKSSKTPPGLRPK